MNGSDLRRRRLRLGWSRNQLAHRLGVSPEAVLEWEDDAASIGCPVATELLLRDGERFESRTSSPESKRYVG